MTVTVCIPAYRSGPALADTVRSALTQSHEDLRVSVAIDPPDDGSADDTAKTLEPLRADPRLSIRTNERRLGWAGNVDSLVRSVDSPLYAILPHDDLWHPRYLETFVAELHSDAALIVAYGDIMRFGATPPVRKSVILPHVADRTAALLHFLIQGTEAQVWRGVTRTEVARRIGGFPTDRHKGFAVECEYALALHGAGVIRHVGRTLYFKRAYGPTVMSASRERVSCAQQERAAAWQEHDLRMSGLLQRALEDMGTDNAQADLCHAAKEGALLRRYQQFVQPSLGPKELVRVSEAIQRCAGSSDALAGEVASNLHLVMRRHWLALDREVEAGAALDQALTAAVTATTATVHAQVLLARGRPLEAIERATEAIRLGCMDDTQLAQRVIDSAYAQLGWSQSG